MLCAQSTAFILLLCFMYEFMTNTEYWAGASCTAVQQTRYMDTLGIYAGWWWSCHIAQVSPSALACDMRVTVSNGCCCWSGLIPGSCH